MLLLKKILPLVFYLKVQIFTFCLIFVKKSLFVIVETSDSRYRGGVITEERCDPCCFSILLKNNSTNFINVQCRIWQCEGNFPLSVIGLYFRHNSDRNQWFINSEWLCSRNSTVLIKTFILLQILILVSDSDSGFRSHIVLETPDTACQHVRLCYSIRLCGVGWDVTRDCDVLLKRDPTIFSATFL